MPEIVRAGGLGFPGEMRRVQVDGSRFDEFTQRLASIRLTRKAALRGLVGSLAALTSGAAFTDWVEAGKKKPVCHCGDAGSTSCTTERVKKKQRKAHLRDHQCDYLGACSSDINACAAAPLLVDNDRLGDPCSNSNPCGANSGLTCDPVLNICVPIDLGRSCATNGQCSTGQCTLGECADCLTICGTTSGTPQCCAVDASCDPVLDRCILD